VLAPTAFTVAIVIDQRRYGQPLCHASRIGIVLHHRARTLTLDRRQNVADEIRTNELRVASSDMCSKPIIYQPLAGTPVVAQAGQSTTMQDRVPQNSRTTTALSCKLREGFGNQGVMGKAVELIGRQIRRKRI